MSDIIIKDQLLPALPATGSELIQSLGIPREALASDEEIQYALQDLSREVLKIPEALKSVHIAKMCMAVNAGLFDGAINYIWNATIIHLRDKIRTFGFSVVA